MLPSAQGKESFREAPSADAVNDTVPFFVVVVVMVVAASELLQKRITAKNAAAAIKKPHRDTRLLLIALFPIP